MNTTKLDDAVDAALWWKELRETNNETFLPLFFEQHRYLVLKGGGGSGKSIFAGRKVLERCATEPGHRYLVCRKVAKTLRESCFNQLVGQARQFYDGAVRRIYGGDMRITFWNGSEILFAGLDDVEKLKSIYNITGIWIEEASELKESDFNQLDIRLRGETRYYKQIIITFNPVSILHWLKKRFFDRKDKRVRTHQSNYRDNRFLDAEAIEVLESFKETDEYYYTVYCLGEWGVLGKSVFNAKLVMKRLLTAPKPGSVGQFEYAEYAGKLKGIRWIEDADGPIKVYRAPLKGRHYVIGGDTAGNGSDCFVGQVLDNRTGEQVCTLRHQYDEDAYAHQMYCLGMYYNTALIGIETNFSTYPVMELERLQYPKQYVRELPDNFDGKIKHAFGFQTNSKTRPLILAGLIRWVRDNIETINDVTTMQEMLTFVRRDDWSPAAEEGAHDDCVMALAIAHYIRPQQEYEDIVHEPDLSHWTQDMWEDYNRASESMKRMMVERFGKPR